MQAKDKAVSITDPNCKFQKDVTTESPVAEIISLRI